MRGPLPWILALVGIVAVILVTAAIGDGRERRDGFRRRVGAERLRRGRRLARRARGHRRRRARSPRRDRGGQRRTAVGDAAGTNGFIRKGLERAVQATDTLVEGVDNAGIPDTPDGEEAAERVSDWADSAQEELEESEDTLDDEADTLEEAIEQLTDAAGTIAAVLASGAQTIVEVSRLDPELAAALRDSSTCQELREETER